MTRTLIVWGCSSGAGKSWLATALCRSAARRGIRVAPFKAQNMSNNARVVARPDGGAGEIGSAQYFQALAAGVVPTTDMNPVLLKPLRDTASQVVVDGIADAALADVPWRERSALLAPRAQAAFERLAAVHDLIVVEGAGSPAEINLHGSDFVNLGTARWAQRRGPVQALLVADIDRGGAFAHCHGTWALLPDDLRGLLAGFVFNRFRGDAALLAPGPAQLQRLTGVPLAGVLPMLRGHGLPEEDALGDGSGAAASGNGAGPVTLRVAVLAPPHISNHDEFQPLLQVPGLALRWVRNPAQLDGTDWIVLPGSKQVSGDLAWLRQRGLADAVQRHAAAGRPVLGICGGLQMLGDVLDDPAGHDGAAVQRLPGLGLLPLTTAYRPQKTLRVADVRFADGIGAPWAALGGVGCAVYEIRSGETTMLAPPAAATTAGSGDGLPGASASAAVAAGPHPSPLPQAGEGADPAPAASVGTASPRRPSAAGNPRTFATASAGVNSTADLHESAGISAHLPESAGIGSASHPPESAGIGSTVHPPESAGIGSHSRLRERAGVRAAAGIGLQTAAAASRGQATAAAAVLFDAAGNAVGWQRGSVLGVCTHGLFESAAVLRALFGAGVPSLDDAFETLADAVDAHIDGAWLRRMFGQ